MDATQDTPSHPVTHAHSHTRATRTGCKEHATLPEQPSSCLTPGICGGTLLAMPSIQEAEEYMMHHQIAAIVAFAVTIGAAVSLAQDALDPCARPPRLMQFTRHPATPGR